MCRLLFANVNNEQRGASPAGLDGVQRKKETGMKFPIEDYNLGPQLQCGSSNGLYRKGGDGFVNDQNKYQHWFFLILPKRSGRSAFVIISNTRD
jgi:hypothetical protein